MSNQKYSPCFFCNESVPVQGMYGVNGVEYRCSSCGNYILDNHVEYMLENEYANKKHILAGYLYETKTLRDYDGKTRDENFNDCYISVAKLNKIFIDPIVPKTVGQKLDKLLAYLYKQTEYFGFEHRIETVPVQVSYSINNTELSKMFAELVSLNLGEYKGLIHGEDGFGFGDGIETPRGYIHRDRNTFILNSKGHKRAETLTSTNIDSRKVFVAMQFSGPLLEGIRDNAIKPACASFGLEAYTIDEKEHNDGIFDRIIAGIRTSKFVIADLTYKNAGAYFEAGYAQGLGIGVFRCCNQEWFNEHGVHFDLRHYNLIVWKDAEHLRKRLMDRISAVFTGSKTIEGWGEDDDE